MVTYEELFLLGTLLVSIVALVINITKKKQPPCFQHVRLNLLTKLWDNRLLGSPFAFSLYYYFIILSITFKISIYK